METSRRRQILAAATVAIGAAVLWVIGPCGESRTEAPPSSAPGAVMLGERKLVFGPDDCALPIANAETLHEIERLKAAIEERSETSRLAPDRSATPIATLGVRFVAETGEPLVEAFRKAHPQAANRGGLVAIATAEAPSGDFDPDALLAWHGVGHYATAQLLGGALAPPPRGCDGVLDLFQPPPVYVSAVYRGRLVASEIAQPGAATITFTVPIAELTASLGVIAFRVQDARGGAMASRAFVTPIDANGFATPVTSVASGELVLAEQPPGAAKLRVESAGHAAVDLEVRAESRRTIDLGVVLLDEPLALAGTLVDPDGRAVEGSVGWSEADAPSPFDPAWLRARRGTSGDGAFSLENLPRRRLLLSAIGTGSNGETFAAWTEADLSRGAIDPIRIPLARTRTVTLAPTVLNADPFTVAIVDAPGRALKRQSALGPGEIQFEMPAGSYRVATRNARGEVRTVPLDVGAEATRLSFEP